MELQDFWIPEAQVAALSLYELEQPSLAFGTKVMYSCMHLMKRNNISFYETVHTCR